MVTATHSRDFAMRTTRNNQHPIWFSVFFNFCFVVLLLIMVVVMELRPFYKMYLLAAICMWILFIVMLFALIIHRDRISIVHILITYLVFLFVAATIAYSTAIGNTLLDMNAWAFVYCRCRMILTGTRKKP